jgi:hypothetical protein
MNQAVADRRKTPQDSVYHSVACQNYMNLLPILTMLRQAHT